MDTTQIFGQPLAPKPEVALPQIPTIPSSKFGPEHKVQYVIELVGPKSSPASTVSSLLDPRWHEALGQPNVFVMAPGDDGWQTLSSRADGSYDSIALAWDMLSEQGELTSKAAEHLLQVAEGFATHLQRRAMPLPPPADIDRYLVSLLDIRESLDIGVEILLVPKVSEFLEKDVWVALSELGYDLKPSGFFEVLPANSHLPLISVTPMGGASSFSLSAVQSGVRHPGLLIGFSLPLSPNPDYSLDAAFKTADHLVNQLHAAAFTDEDRPLSHSVRAEMRQNLGMAVQALEGVGIVPGSLASQILFG